MDTQKKIFLITLISLLLISGAFLIYGWRGPGGEEPWQRTYAYQALSPEERRSCDQMFQAMFEYYEKAHAVSLSQAKRAFPDQEYENWVPRLCTSAEAPLTGSPPEAPPPLVPLPAPELPNLPVPRGKGRKPLSRVGAFCLGHLCSQAVSAETHGGFYRSSSLERNLHTFSAREEKAMSFEITLTVNDLNWNGETVPEPHEGVVKALEEMEGIVAVRYDPKSRRFCVGYDPHRVTILRILSRIEAVGKQAGRIYRPADVKTTSEPHHLAWNLQRPQNGLPKTPFAVDRREQEASLGKG